MELKIEYKLKGVGWAECILLLDEKVLKIPVSYISNPLDSLLVAAISICKGEPEARVSLYDEPGEFRIIINRLENNEVKVLIVQFRDGFLDLNDDEGDIVLTFQYPLSGFLRVVINLLESVLKEYGIKGYKEKWVEHDFPLEKLERLKSEFTKMKFGEK